MQTQHRKSFGQPEVAIAIYFFSGIAALILQISWSRQIGLLLGQTIHAATTVLAAYFIGMAIGYLVGAGRRFSRRPLAAYGVCELVIGLWAMLVPTLLRLGELPTMAALLSSTSATGQIAMRSLFCFVVLLPATISMGATLPLMTEFLSRKHSDAIGHVSLAYGLNTIGAVVGVLAASFLLLAQVGVRASGFLAAGISACCGIAAVLFDRLSQRETRPEPSGSIHDNLPDRQLQNSKKWAVFAGVCGFATLSLEVLYTRLFSLVFHNSTYTFAVIVAVFLAGIALGAFLMTYLHRRFTASNLLTASALLAAGAVVVSVFLFIGMTRFKYWHYGDTFQSYFFGSLGLVGLVAAPPAILAGILLPSLWHASGSTKRTLRETVARLTFGNTIAAAFGAVVTTFLFLPTIGLWGTFGIVATLFVAIAVYQLAHQSKRAWAAVTALLALCVVFPAVLSVDRVTRSKRVLGGQLIRRWPSAYGWIDMVRTDDGALEVRQNLHYRHGATGKNAVREYRQAHIPLLLHGNPRDVLFLGLGTGLTAGPSVMYPEVERVNIVELIPEVVTAARTLNENNFGVVDHSKTTIHIDDARHFLAATANRFDVIISDLYVPWESHTGYLYTVEHYRSAVRRLKPDGMFCQWLPAYQLSEESFELIADSFASVFPTTTIWWGRLNCNRPIVALIGSARPVTVDIDSLRRRFLKRPALAFGNDLYLRKADDLKRLYLGCWPARSDRTLNTDEHPRVEFRSPFAQWDGRLLQGLVFREYFDRMWLQLPTGGIHWTDDNGPPCKTIRQQRVEQRFILFGT